MIDTERRETRRWWIKLFLQPALLLACGMTLIAGLGTAQRLGFISAGGGGSHASSDGGGTRYICPMMCTPPQAEPGRCPVCAMELVPATSSVSSGERSIEIDPVARRLANIRTAAVTAAPVARTIRAVGELSYDEGGLKTISAYVDGRIERLYADYLGVAVDRGDDLALVYSPRLYSAQVELLLAKKSRDESRSSTSRRPSQAKLYASAKRRLIEMGATEPQIERLEASGEANSRVHLCAPIGGTVIEKHVVEGQYVKEGQAIYRLADLSTVWLMLELFPEDAAAIREGQDVDAQVQSLPGQHFAGRVAFIDPNVDPRTRTVGVRVAIPNEDGRLRVGDWAKATIRAPLGELAGGERNALVIPRDAVLAAGAHSVVYVETEPGRFEIRPIVLGPVCGDRVVVLQGVNDGERVATRGAFLIDSQMQLAGNPSLIDPTKAKGREDEAPSEAPSSEMVAALSKLSAPDRALAESQRICPVTEAPLGSMGTPPKVDVQGQTFFICCEGCRKRLLEEPQVHLAKLPAARVAENPPDSEPRMDLPPIGAIEIVEPQGSEPANGDVQVSREAKP